MDKIDKFKILSTGNQTYIELCGKTMGTGITSVKFEHNSGEDVILCLKLRLSDFEFMPDGYFDELIKNHVCN